jgi:hypothetical protein
MLLGIALLLATGSLAGAALLRHRAPAVSLGLVGGVAGGLYGLHFAYHHDPKSVPADVAVWATCGLLAFGLLGLLLTPRGPARTLRHIAAWCAALAPLFAAALAIALLWACPLYVTKNAGFCFHEIDVLGGWITSVTFLFIVDAAVLVVMLLVSAKEVTANEPEDLPVRNR